MLARNPVNASHFLLTLKKRPNKRHAISYSKNFLYNREETTQNTTRVSRYLTFINTTNKYRGLYRLSQQTTAHLNESAYIFIQSQHLLLKIVF